MAKSPKKQKAEDIETEPDGWDRFTKTAMAPAKPKRPARRPSKHRVRKN